MGPYLISNPTLLTSLVGKDAVVPAPDKAFGVQCVGLVKMLSKCGPTSGWKKGDGVRGNTALQKGTAIATFNDQGHYSSAARGNHACFFIEFAPEDGGIVVLEQHVPPDPNKIHTRCIRFRGQHPGVDPSDNGDAFSIIL